jgi:hypothetical protein
MSVIARYLIGQPLLLIVGSVLALSHASADEAAMSDSVSSRLLVGCLLLASNAILSQIFSFGLRFEDLTAQSSVVMSIGDKFCAM